MKIHNDRSIQNKNSLAILYAAEAYSLSGKIMGRQSTGAALMQAIADTKPSRLLCYAASRAAAQNCAQTLASLGSPRTGVDWIPLDQPERLQEAGTLYRPDPGIGQHAWHRLTRSNARAYSICGVTQTISSYGPMTAFTEYLTAPVESWDALICTSTVSREAVRHVLERSADHLRERLGAQRFTLPQMPVIPLGIHVRHLATSADLRAAARARLGLADDEIAVLYAGRLIVHGKAHPLPMYLALEQAAQGRKVVLIQAGQAPNESTLKIYTEESKRFCPSVRTILVDGGNFDLYRQTWAAADIFTSLSDNIQETFGITPVEAMAAGLPVVVSDWDGYKDTVRDGIDGFRVPTLTLPGGSGGDLAERYDAELINYDYYIGYAAQFVAVDVEATAQAYRRLIDDPALRQRMGEAGARRAREVYDWSVIFRRYETLWSELAERRRSDPQVAPPLTRRRRPDRDDPFSMFEPYPTYHVGPGISFRRRNDISLDDALARRELASTAFAKPVLPTPELISAILHSVEADWVSFAAIVQANHAVQQSRLASALVWLSKVGILDFRRI